MAEIERIEVMKMASNSTNWNRDAMDGSFEVCYRTRERERESEERERKWWRMNE